MNHPTESIVSATITIGKMIDPIDELSSIEQVDTTNIIDHTSTLLISSANDSCSTGRRLVLTTSSLDENQKSKLNKFFSLFF
jgi:hypothetical protein